MLTQSTADSGSGPDPRCSPRSRQAAEANLLTSLSGISTLEYSGSGTSVSTMMGDESVCMYARARVTRRCLRATRGYGAYLETEQVPCPFRLVVQKRGRDPSLASCSWYLPCLGKAAVAPAVYRVVKQCTGKRSSNKSLVSSFYFSGAYYCRLSTLYLRDVAWPGVSKHRGHCPGVAVVVSCEKHVA